MTTYSTYMHYFERLAAEHQLIKTFIDCDEDQILEDERGKLRFPLLYLDDPIIRLTDDDSRMGIWTGELKILENFNPNDSRHDKKARKDLLYQIALDIIGRLHADSDVEEFCFCIRNVALEYCHYLHNSANQGFRIRFTFEDTVALRCDNRNFKSSCPIGSMAAFFIDNKTDGSFQDLTITDQSTPDDVDWTYLWEYQIDGGDVIASEDVPDLSRPGKLIIINLTISLEDGCELHASLCMGNSCTRYYSIPQRTKWIK